MPQPCCLLRNPSRPGSSRLGEGPVETENLVGTAMRGKALYLYSSTDKGQEKQEEPAVPMSRSNCQRQTGLTDRTLSGGQEM